MADINKPDITEELQNAQKANEKTQYYWKTLRNGGKCIKLYKPSVAQLVSQKTGLEITPMFQ